jgi:hypothetical protein
MQEFKRVTLSLIKSAVAGYIVGSVILLVVLAIGTLLHGCSAYAAVEPFKMQRTYINYKDILKNGHNPLMTGGSVATKEINLHLDTDVFKYFYYNNMIWSLWDQHQVRWIGWNFKIGARVLPFLDLQYEHFSKHILDKEYPFRWPEGQRFPVEDSIGFNLYLYRADKTASIF